LKVAYVDSSCFVSIALGEPFYRELLVSLRRFDRLISSNLLEAELRSALARERKVGTIKNLLAWLTWVYPTRPLTPEFDRILEIGTLRGSDLWHLACALSLVSKVPGALAFVTNDRRQGEIARALGFPGL